MEADTMVAQNMKLASEIIEEHTDTIRGAIWFHVNDKSSIDDVFQDFFLSLVHRPIPQRVQNIKAYINISVKNDVLDAAYKTKSCHLRNRKYAEMYKDSRKSDTPEGIASHTEEIRQLFDIVEDQLLQHETEAIIQKYRHDRDTAEIAEAMNINKRSVSCYLCTGLRKLRKIVCQEQSQQDNCFVEENAMI